MTLLTVSKLQRRPDRNSNTNVGSPSAWRPKAVGLIERLESAASTAVRNFTGVIMNREDNREIPTSQAPVPIDPNQSGSDRLDPMAKQKKTERVPKDSVRQLISDRLTELRLEMKQVSKQIGKNDAYLHQYLEYDTPQRGLDEETRAALAPILGVKPAALKKQIENLDVPGMASIELEPSNVRSAPTVRLDRASKRPEDVPVLGVVRGGTGDGFELNMGEPLDYVRRPVSLIGKGGVYALHIEGDSMAPRYEPGETILVYFNKPPLIGRDVVVQVRPRKEGDAPRAYLKRLTKRTATEIHLEQFRPPATMVIKMADIISIHMVLTRDEMI
jgi:phage repressor protein C with HTH and peptisase S24 domain